MSLKSAVRPLSRIAVALLAAAMWSCGDGGPTDPTGAVDLPEDQPLASVMPDLAPEPGTVGTERYVPTLERVLRRAVSVIRTKKGEEAAAAILAEARRLQADVRAAKEGGDEAAFKEAARRMEGFAARVGLRVFGTPLARHVAGDAAGRLQELMPRLRAAHEAGHDVSRLVKGAQGAQKSLSAARDAWENDKPVTGLVLAARALDVVTKIGALLA